MKGRQGPKYRDVCFDCKTWMAEQKLIVLSVRQGFKLPNHFLELPFYGVCVQGMKGCQLHVVLLQWFDLLWDWVWQVKTWWWQPARKGVILNSFTKFNLWFVCLGGE